MILATHKVGPRDAFLIHLSRFDIRSSSSEEDEAECCGEWRKCGALRRLMKCCCHPGQSATDLIMGGLPSKCADSRSYECCCGAIDRPATAQLEREEVQAVVAEAEVAVEAY